METLSTAEVSHFEQITGIYYEGIACCGLVSIYEYLRIFCPVSNVKWGEIW